MDLMCSPTSTSRSSFDSSQQSPMSLGSMESPHEPVFVNLRSGLEYIILEDTLGLGLAPFLEITEQPQDKFRFRYVSEMHGTHGCILGVKKSRVHKTYPSVELKNYTGDAIIRCTLYTVDAEHRVQHPHTLVAKNGSTETEEPHDKMVPCISSGYKVEFQGIGIIHTARKKVCDALFEKKQKRKMEELGTTTLSVVQQNDLRESAAKDAKSINLNSVCLCFEAFTRDSTGSLMALCHPVFSNAIHNMKSALTGDLKLTRIDKVAGSCKGNEEIFIFVEKVNKKNIKVRFFEVDDDGNETWHDYGKFTELDVHHQYAIAFKTPPYKNTHLMENKEVYLELYRPTDGVRSECKKFTYKPQERDLYAPRKRARTECEATVTLPALQAQPSSSTVTAVTEDVFLANLDTEDIDNLGYMSITTPSFEQFLHTVNNQDYFNMLTAEQQQGIAMTQNMIGCDAALAPNAKKERTSNANSAKKSSDMNLEDFAEQVISKMEQANQSTTMTYKDKKDVITNLSEQKLNGDNALHTAIKCHQMNVLVKLLRIMSCVTVGGQPLVSINEFNSQHQTPLYLSVLSDKPKMLEALLENNADPLIECNGTSALQLAVELNNIKCVEILLTVTPRLNLTKENIVGYPLLHQAIEQNNIKTVVMLLDSGADPTQADTSSGCTPLHMAVKKKAVPIVQLLLADSRVDINATNAAGNTSLHIACVLDEPESVEICKILLDAKANPWLENNVPAVKVEREDEDSDCKAETQDENESPAFRGQTAFDLACQNSEILELLRQAVVRCDADEVVHNMEMMELKAEPLSPVMEDALDTDTLEEVAQLLQPGDAWKELAQCMGLEHHIPELEKLEESAKKLLLGCMGQVTTGELRELLEALNQREAMDKVDAMMARRLAQLPNN